eukprot:RCo042702
MSDDQLVNLCVVKRGVHRALLAHGDLAPRNTLVLRVELVPQEHMVERAQVSLLLPFGPRGRGNGLRVGLGVKDDLHDPDLHLDGLTHELFGFIHKGVVDIAGLPRPLRSVLPQGHQLDMDLPLNLPRGRHHRSGAFELHHVRQGLQPHVGLSDEEVLVVGKGVLRGGLVLLAGLPAAVPVLPLLREGVQTGLEFVHEPLPLARALANHHAHVGLVRNTVLEDLRGELDVPGEVPGDLVGLLAAPQGVVELQQEVLGEARAVAGALLVHRSLTHLLLGEREGGIGRVLALELGVPLLLTVGEDEAEGVVPAKPQAVMMLKLGVLLYGASVDQHPSVLGFLPEVDPPAVKHHLAVVGLHPHPVELELRGVLGVHPPNYRIPTLDLVDQGVRQPKVGVEVAKVGQSDLVRVLDACPSQSLPVSVGNLLGAGLPLAGGLLQLTHSEVQGLAHLLCLLLLKLEHLLQLVHGF